MEGGEDQNVLVEDEEPRKLIQSGCTFGRVINACIAFNYLLVLLTALIVSGSLGVLNHKLAADYPDTSTNNRTCILFTSCPNPNGQSSHCSIEYNSSGGCEFIVAGFGIVGFFALVYMALCVVRMVFATNIGWTVVSDILANIFILLWVFIMGVTISIGFAYTCSQVNSFYTGSSSVSNCSAMTVPAADGYLFYRETNVAQGAAWFCFLFLFFSMVIFIVRSCIFCRRKATIPALNNTDILTATDTFEEEDEKAAKPV